MIRLVFNVPSRPSHLSSIAAKRRWIDTLGSVLLSSGDSLPRQCTLWHSASLIKVSSRNFLFFFNSLTKNNSIWISNPHKLRARIQSVVCKGLFWRRVSTIPFPIYNKFVFCLFRLKKDFDFFLTQNLSWRRIDKAGWDLKEVYLRVVLGFVGNKRRRDLDWISDKTL